MKPDVAFRQQQADQAAVASTISKPFVTGAAEDDGQFGSTGDGPSPGPGGAKPSARPKRYHGTVELDATRVGRDAGASRRKSSPISLASWERT